MDTRIGPVGLTGTVAGEGSVGYPLASTCLYVRQEECEMPSEECFVMWCDELAFYDATGEWRSKEGRDAFGEHIPHWYHTCVVPRYETDYQQYYPEGDLLASIYLRMLHAPEETRDFLLHEGVWFYDD